MQAAGRMQETNNCESSEFAFDDSAMKHLGATLATTTSLIVNVGKNMKTSAEMLANASPSSSNLTKVK